MQSQRDAIKEELFTIKEPEDAITEVDDATKEDEVALLGVGVELIKSSSGHGEQVAEIFIALMVLVPVATFEVVSVAAAVESDTAKKLKSLPAFTDLIAM